MKYIFIILVIASYLLAFSINLMPALKHPDLHGGLLNLVASLLFIALLLRYVKKGSKIVKVFSLLGVVSGVVVFSIATFESTMIGNGILDVIVSIQYPFYLIFTTPLFGGNILFDLSYGAYSLLMSLFYGVVFGLSFICVDSFKTRCRFEQKSM